jgi:ABC-type polysaccharide/polyol phosphate transport system ATPase subunit
MNRPAITVEGLWKQYTVGAAQARHDTFYDLLTHAIKAPFSRLRNLGGRTAEAEQFWALRDVEFAVQPGEVLGIVGRNGAGKSTLLKILSRITAPTLGRVTVLGRMSSLLEVGTGFHPELSGRENIFLNGALLGMSRADITRKFDAIVEFAEIGKFIDTPVKRYSSGMYVRLAFAVASHLEPDILVVDEVLAVGDFEFQRKCLGKMKDVSGDGRTVLFVSHNTAAVQTLCSKALLLDGGTVSVLGPVDAVINQYLENIGGGSGVVETQSGALQLVSVQADCTPIDGGQVEISVSLGFDCVRDISDLFVDFGLENKQGARFLQIVPDARGVTAVAVRAGSQPQYRVKARMTALAPGDYFATVYAHSRLQGTVLHQTSVALFRVDNSQATPECMSAGFTALLLPGYEARIHLEND